MSAHLLDVNVLIALAWPSHAHHEAAHHWFSLGNEDSFHPLTPIFNSHAHRGTNSTSPRHSCRLWGTSTFRSTFSLDSASS